MYDILAVEISPIGWYRAEKTRDVPFRFASAKTIEIVMASSGCPVPLGVKLLPIKPDFTFSAFFISALDLKGRDLSAVGSYSESQSVVFRTV